MLGPDSWKNWSLGHVGCLNVFGFALGLRWLQRDLGLPFLILPRVTKVVKMKLFLAEIKPFYLNRIAFSLLTYSPPVVLGAIVAPAQFAAYGVAEYFYKCLLAIAQIGNQALYPYVVRTRNQHHFWISFLVLALCILFLAFLMLCTHAMVINALFGRDLVEANNFVPLFLLLGFVSFLNIFMGFSLAALHDNFRPVNISTPLAAILYVVLFSALGGSENFNPRHLILIVIFCEFVSLIIRLQVFRLKDASDIT